MTFTYSGNPATSDTDTIRFLIQDTDSTDAQFSDEEIQYFLSQMTGFNDAYIAANLCEILAAKYAREVAISADGVSVGADQLQQKYGDLAGRLRAMAATFGMVGNGPIVTSDCPDQTVPPKTFGRRINDNIRAGAQDFGGVTPWEWSWLEYEYGGWWDG